MRQSFFARDVIFCHLWDNASQPLKEVSVSILTYCMFKYSYNNIFWGLSVEILVRRGAPKLDQMALFALMIKRQGLEPYLTMWATKLVY